MPGKDTERWQKNDNGSWSRKLASGVEETTYVNPDATAGALEAAEELGVDLASVSGSGKDGKITKADVEATVAD